MVVIETIHHMNCERRGGIGEVALRIYISKTYDRASWSSIHAMMLKVDISKAYDQVMYGVLEPPMRHT